MLIIMRGNNPVGNELDKSAIQHGDRIICENFEELVKTDRDLGRMGIDHHQLDPLEITVI
ncbi:MAG: hypothetical protein IKN54_07275 [Lachnospiraceae bacterium]|nr:hypothetical protein [Lachnospiraceae bacterium]